MQATSLLMSAVLCASVGAYRAVLRVPTGTTAPAVTMVADTVSSGETSSISPKEKLKEGLRREYDSFFQPMEDELYSPTVSFEDPMISFSGIDKYRNNVDMLAGVTPLGKLCFTDCALEMHSVSDTVSVRLGYRTPRELGKR